MFNYNVDFFFLFFSFLQISHLQSKMMILIATHCRLKCLILNKVWQRSVYHLWFNCSKKRKKFKSIQGFVIESWGYEGILNLGSPSASHPQPLAFTQGGHRRKDPSYDHNTITFLKLVTFENVTGTLALLCKGHAEGEERSIAATTCMWEDEY